MQLRTAVVVVDMLADSLDLDAGLAITAHALAIVPRINRVTAAARTAGLPVVFACDSFLPGDFIFGGRMAPHALSGTPGAEPSALLLREPTDIVLRKRRFSAFFDTDLARILRSAGVDGIAVCGITTHVCVLTTALDAICHDLHVLVLGDCCAAHRADVHEAALGLYRSTPLYPLLRVLTAEEYLGEFVERGFRATSDR